MNGVFCVPTGKLTFLDFFCHIFFALRKNQRTFVQDEALFLTRYIDYYKVAARYIVVFKSKQIICFKRAGLDRI